MPFDMKTAIIVPRLKKVNRSPSELSNYRPVSKLSILPKILVRLVVRRLLKHLDNNNLLPARKSAYWRFHSTETALLQLVSDIVTKSETGNITLLSLLDMSAAFDTVDHALLLGKLEQCYGICEKVYDWISSHLKDRSQTVHHQSSTSTRRVLKYCVLQGSFLGPVLFLLYIREINHVIDQYNLQSPCYADDCQSIQAVNQTRRTNSLNRH